MPSVRDLASRFETPQKPDASAAAATASSPVAHAASLPSDLRPAAAAPTTTAAPQASTAGGLAADGGAGDELGALNGGGSVGVGGSSTGLTEGFAPPLPPPRPPQAAGVAGDGGAHLSLPLLMVVEIERLRQRLRLAIGLGAPGPEQRQRRERELMEAVERQVRLAMLAEEGVAGVGPARRKDTGHGMQPLWAVRGGTAAAVAEGQWRYPLGWGASNGTPSAPAHDSSLRGNVLVVRGSGSTLGRQASLDAAERGATLVLVCEAQLHCCISRALAGRDYNS
jgi:hypothetical protein